MDNIQQFKDELDKSFGHLRSQIDTSFALMSMDPSEKNDMINLWTDHILSFVSHTFKVSEKYNNRDVFKAITKALIFGK